ncbi:MAG: glycosyltransferase family 2 protein [Ginsengibacter sp.]
MLSVIIPCYNSEKYIDRAIESVLNQTYSDYEMILVDNNSSDNTRNILHGYRKKYPEIVKVLVERKQGSPAARNTGLFSARGEWIQFLDADDELLPEKFASQMQMADNLALDIVVGNSRRYKTFSNGELKEMPRYIETTNIWQALLTSQLGITSGNLWRKKALLAINGWNENLTSSQEYDLLFRLLKNDAVIGFCPLVQTLMHVTENSISTSRNENRVVEIMNNSIRLRMDIKKYLKSKGMLTKELSRCADLYNYSTLVMRDYKPFIPLYFRNGKIPEYVRKMLRENHFDVPFGAVAKLYIRRIFNIIQQFLIKSPGKNALQ